MKKRLAIWIVLNIIWLIGLPVVCGVYLYNDLQYQYETGFRVSTDGDSISIPIFAITILNFLFVFSVNLIILIVNFFKNKKAQSDI